MPVESGTALAPRSPLSRPLPRASETTFSDSSQTLFTPAGTAQRASGGWLTQLSTTGDRLQGISSIGVAEMPRSGVAHSPNRVEIVTGGAPQRRRRGEADGRTRTGDPFITSEVLYQLSYVGERPANRHPPSAGVPRIVADPIAHTAAILHQAKVRQATVDGPATSDAGRWTVCRPQCRAMRLAGDPPRTACA